MFSRSACAGILGQAKEESDGENDVRTAGRLLRVCIWSEDRPRSAGCAPVRDGPQDRLARGQLGHFGETRFAHEDRNSMLVSELCPVEEMRDDAVDVTGAPEIERVEGAPAS